VRLKLYKNNIIVARHKSPKSVYASNIATTKQGRGSWHKANDLSGGSAPASFKGFANVLTPNPPACGGTWKSDPGNSCNPPDTVPAYINVIAASSITKSGPVINGNSVKMVILKTDPGYGPAPGHTGTRTVTAVICSQ
jgi:hypothetical protein